MALLSFAANIFFLATRNRVREPERGIFTGGYVEEPLLMGPVAYGQVQRGFPVKSVVASGTSALLPPAAYVIPDGMVPQVSGALPLYRDQGVPLDESEVQRIFDRLGVTFHWKDLQLLPTLEKWRSADRTMDVTLDIEKRALTVTRTGAFSPSPEGRAGDDTVVAIAREFADSFGVDITPYGDPRIEERATEPGGPLKTYVVWPMLFAGVPLLDIDAKPVPSVQIQVGRLSRKALSMTVTLLKNDRMSQSAYPRTSRESIIASLGAGGLLPLSSTLPGKKTDVVYTGLTQSYVLLLGDREFTTYIVPTVLADYIQAGVRGRTFVPAISPDQFFWHPMPKTPAPLSSSAQSATGAVKTASGTTR